MFDSAAVAFYLERNTVPTDYNSSFLLTKVFLNLNYNVVQTKSLKKVKKKVEALHVQSKHILTLSYTMMPMMTADEILELPKHALQIYQGISAHRYKNYYFILQMSNFNRNTNAQCAECAPTREVNRCIYNINQHIPIPDNTEIAIKPILTGATSVGIFLVSF